MIRRPALLAAIIVFLAGVCFAVAQPPVWGADEPAHLYRAWQISTGGLTPTKIGEHDGIPEYGGPIPTGLVDLAEAGTGRQWGKPLRSPVMDDWGKRQQLMRAPVGSTTRTMNFVNSAAYAPVSYAPAVVGLWVARVLQLDAGATVLAARLAGVVAAALAAWLALTLLRGTGWQWAAFVVACLPSALFQAGSISADTMTNATGLVFAAAFLRLALTDAPPTRAATWALAVATVVIAVVKPTYAVLALLLLAMPARRLQWGAAQAGDAPRSGAGRLTRFGGPGLLGAMLLAVALAATWLRIAAGTTAGMGVVRGASEEKLVRPTDQQDYLLTHLSDLPGLAYRTLADYIPKYLKEVFVQTGYQVEGSGMAMILTLMALGLAWFLAPRPVARRWALGWTGLVVAGAAGAIFLALYLSFTPVGLWVVSGVQGRYFVPLLLLALAVLRSLVPLRLVPDATSLRRADDAVSTARMPDDTTSAERIGGRIIVTIVIVSAILAIAKYTLLMWVTVS